jgi:hypothetical protein
VHSRANNPRSLTVRYATSPASTRLHLMPIKEAAYKSLLACQQYVVACISGSRQVYTLVCS